MTGEYRYGLAKLDEAAFEGGPGPHLLNPMGGVHGGWALTLTDSATDGKVLAHGTSTLLVQRP